MTDEEREAIGTARRDVEAIEMLIDAVEAKSGDPDVSLCLRGLGTLVGSVGEHLRAIEKYNGSEGP